MQKILANKAQIFILSTAGAMAAIGYLLVGMNKDSLGIVSLTTYIGIIVMAVSMKLSGYLLGEPRTHADGRKYGDVMDWAMLLFIWPSYVTPLILLPYLIGNMLLIFGLFAVGISLFAGVSLYALSISQDRLTAKRRHSKWFYFIPAFLYTVPALLIGYFVVAKFSDNLNVMRIANIGGLLLGGLFSFYCIKLALFDLFTYEVRKYAIMDLLPLFLVIPGIVVVAEFALPLFAGKVEQMYLLYTLSIFALTVAQVLGVLSVTRRAKF
jgi:hypothetical protein